MMGSQTRSSLASPSRIRDAFTDSGNSNTTDDTDADTSDNSADSDADAEGSQCRGVDLDEPDSPLYDNYCSFCRRPIRHSMSDSRCISHVTATESED
jgi:hypothetical protein